MKATTMAALAFGLIAGFALGGIGPRRDLGALKKRYTKLEQELAEAERPGFMSKLLPTLSEAVSGPPRALPQAPQLVDGGVQAHDASVSSTNPDVVVVQRDPEANPGPTLQPSSANDGGTPNATAAQAPLAHGDLVDHAPASPRPEGPALLAGFDEAVTVQQARAAATRAAIIDQGRLNPQQIKALDLSMSRMNQELGGYGDKVLSLMESEDAPSATDALEVGHKVSGILLEHQRELDAILSSAQGEVAKDDSARQVWNLVDFEAFRPAVERRLVEGGGQAAPLMGTAGAPGGQAP